MFPSWPSVAARTLHDSEPRLISQVPKGGTEIAIDQVSSTRLKKATAFINGHIQFSLLGDAETTRGAFDAAQDENSIMFTKRQQPGFETARELVDLYRETARNDTQLPGGASSSADELQEPEG